MPNWRMTLIFSGIFTGLAVYVYFFELKKPEPLPGDEKAVIVWSLDDNQKKAFRYLEIVTDSQKAVLDQDDRGDWTMLAPRRLKLDSTRLDYTLNNLKELRAERLIEEKDARPADFGLDKPVLRITLADKDKKPLHELLGGGQSPTKSGYYVQKKGEPRIYLISTWRLDDVKRIVSDPPTPPPTPKPTPTPRVSPSPSPSVVSASPVSPTVKPSQPSRPAATALPASPTVKPKPSP